jgi:hypothetical protein
MDRKYYTINEETARTANMVNSFREYAAGNVTMAYQARVNVIYNIVDLIREKKPNLADKAVRMAERYSRKLAEYYNAYYRNEASCPSVMICGPANFPTRKKARQNARRDSLMYEWEYLETYAAKINHLLTQEQPILSNDENVIELLTEKIADLEAEKASMKAINAHYRKHGNLDDYDGLITQDMQRHLEFIFRHDFIHGSLFSTTNINQEIKRNRDRLEEITRVKEAGTSETVYEDFTVIENTELMRLQIIFDGKPEPEVRDILKSNGFKWAPSQNAWQRQLTANAKYSLKRTIEQLKKLQTA